MDIISSTSIENIVAKRDAAVARLHSVVEQLSMADAEFHALCGSYLSDVAGGRDCALFEPRGIPAAILAMDASIWQQLLLDSGIRSFMASADRARWDSMILEKKVPELTLENVKATFGDLYAKRGEMFVDGVVAVFRNLSWCHKTNEPFAFGKKIIMADLWTDKGQYLSRAKCDVLDDLLRALHILGGKPEPDVRSGMNYRIDRVARPVAVWDDQAKQRVRQTEPSDTIEDTYFTIRWYKKSGTAHITFKRPDLIEAMNKVLGSRFPNAIASDVRNPSNLPEAAATPQARPLCAAVVGALRQLRADGNALVGLAQLDREIYEKVDEVLTSLGGKWDRGRRGHVFAEDGIEEITHELRLICRDGAWFAPKDFGFVQTPDNLVDDLLVMADVSPGMLVLEPSAGRGAIVKRLLSHGCRVHAIEAMRSNLGYLRKLDCKVSHGDFLNMHVDRETTYHCIVMNPPFERHQDIAHIMRALHWLRPGGRLVSVMSAGVRHNSDRYSKMFRAYVADHGEFVSLPSGSFKASGTMVNTVAVVLTKPDPARQIRASQAAAAPRCAAPVGEPQLVLV